MRNDDLINEVVTPYYEQIQELAELREDFDLPYAFMVQLLELFKKNCLFELRYLFKVERLFTRKQRREEYRKVKAMFKKARVERIGRKHKEEAEEISQEQTDKSLAVVNKELTETDNE